MDPENPAFEYYISLLISSGPSPIFPPSPSQPRFTKNFAAGVRILPPDILTIITQGPEFVNTHGYSASYTLTFQFIFNTSGKF